MNKEFEIEDKYLKFNNIVLFFIAIVYSLFFTIDIYNLYITKTIAFYVITATLLIVFLKTQRNSKDYYYYKLIKIKYLNISFVLLCFLAIISTIFSKYIIESLVGVTPNLLSTIFYVFVLIFINIISPIITKLKLHRLLNIFIIVFILISIVISIQFYYTDIIYKENIDIKLFFALGNRNYAVVPFSLLLILSIFNYLNNTKKHYMIIPIALFLNIVLISLTRGAWLSLFGTFTVLSIYILIFNKKFLINKNKKILNIFIVFILVFILSNVFSDFKVYDRIFNNVNITASKDFHDLANEFSSDRLNTWKQGLKLMNKPKRVLIGISPAVANNYGIRYTNFHNQYIESLVTLGIFGFIGFILFIIFLNYYSFLITKKEFNNIGLLGCSIFISIKWFFNSINSLNFIYSLLIICIILGKYMDINSMKFNNKI